MAAQGSSRKLDDDEEIKAKVPGQRNMNGWLILNDGSQYLSAQHSIFWNKFSQATKGYQSAACCTVAVATSKLEDVNDWTEVTLDKILEDGDRLYQDSFLQFKPENSKNLSMEQILRRFFTPSGFVCRVMVYQPRQKGEVSKDLYSQLIKFFGQDRAGVLVAKGGEESVALFKSNLGYYMFDPTDRDRYGRSIAPLYRGLGKACLSLYPCVQPLAEKLAKNIAPLQCDDTTKEGRRKNKVAFEIYGMQVRKSTKPVRRYVGQNVT